MRPIKEPYTNKQKPNENIYLPCNELINIGVHSNDNYRNFSNRISAPPVRTGMFTQLKKGPINCNNYYNSIHKQDVVCSDYNSSKYFPDNKIIDYKNNTFKGLLDPMDPYSSPEDDSIIMYNDSRIQKNFLDCKQQQIPEILKRATF